MTDNSNTLSGHACKANSRVPCPGCGSVHETHCKCLSVLVAVVNSPGPCMY